MGVYLCRPGELKTKCSHPDLTRNLRKELRNHTGLELGFHLCLRP
jgi:hypothetical protein